MATVLQGTADEACYQRVTMAQLGVQYMTKTPKLIHKCAIGLSKRPAIILEWFIDRVGHKVAQKHCRSTKVCVGKVPFFSS